MAIGMTYDQYWYGDVCMARAFVLADREKQKRINESAWLYGAYVLKALDATVGNAFRKEGAKPAEYPLQPVGTENDVSETQEQMEERKAKEQEKERLRLVAYLNSVMTVRKSME